MVAMTLSSSAASALIGHGRGGGVPVTVGAASNPLEHPPLASPPLPLNGAAESGSGHNGGLANLFSTVPLPKPHRQTSAGHTVGTGGGSGLGAASSNAPTALPPLSIRLTEPIVFLRGTATGEDYRGRRQFAHPDASPAIIRGLLTLRLAKPTRIKRIEIKLEGKSRTEWPEGIGPRRTETSEEHVLVQQSITFFNAAQSQAHIPSYKPFAHGAASTSSTNPNGSTTGLGSTSAASTLHPTVSTVSGSGSGSGAGGGPLALHRGRAVSMGPRYHSHSSADDDDDVEDFALEEGEDLAGVDVEAEQEGRGRPRNRPLDPLSSPNHHHHQTSSSAYQEHPRSYSAMPITTHHHPPISYNHRQSLLRERGPSPAYSERDPLADRRAEILASNGDNLSLQSSPVSRATNGHAENGNGSRYITRMPSAEADISELRISPERRSRLPSIPSEPSSVTSRDHSAEVGDRGGASDMNAHAGPSTLRNRRPRSSLSNPPAEDALNGFPVHRTTSSDGNSNHRTSIHHELAENSSVNEETEFITITRPGSRRSSLVEQIPSPLVSPSASPKLRPRGSRDSMPSGLRPAAVTPAAPVSGLGFGFGSTSTPASTSNSAVKAAQIPDSDRGRKTTKFLSSVTNTFRGLSIGSRSRTRGPSDESDGRPDPRGGAGARSRSPSGSRGRPRDDSPAFSNWKEFKRGTYNYPISFAIPADTPPTVHADFGSVTYRLRATVVRAGALSPNFVDEKEIILVSSPPEEDTEETENVIVERQWEDQMSYLIALSGKAFPVGGQIPMSLRIMPLSKCSIYRLTASLEEKVDYFAMDRHVARHEAVRRYPLLSLKHDDKSRLLPIFAESEDAVQNSPLAPLAVKALSGDQEVDDAVASLLNPTGPWFLECALQVPDCSQRIRFSTKHAKSNIAVGHWLKVVMRVERGDDTALDTKGRRKQFDIIIETPLHLLNCRVNGQLNTLPTYAQFPISGQHIAISSCRVHDNAQTEDNLLLRNIVFDRLVSGQQTEAGEEPPSYEEAARTDVREASRVRDQSTA